MHILHLTLPFEYACGISRHVWSLAREQRRSHRVTVGTSGGAALELLDADAVSRLLLPSWGARMNPWEAARCIGMLTAFVRRQRVEVLHAHHRYYALIGRIVSSLTGRTPVVATCHSITPGLSLLSYPVDRVIAVSHATHRFLRDQYGIADDRIALVPHALPPAPPGTPPLDPRVASLNGRLLVVAAGRLSVEKGFDTLIEALALVRERQPLAMGVLIGEGPLRPELERLAVSLGAPVLFAGVARSVHGYFSRAALVVQPSRIETASLTVLEAGALARPVVVTGVGGLAELVSHGSTGLVVPPSEPKQLADAISTLLENEALRRRLGDALRKSVTSRLDPQSMVRATADVYQSAGAQ
jgi:glycosyltransferase involved in cell wall biosynthesis